MKIPVSTLRRRLRIGLLAAAAAALVAGTTVAPAFADGRHNDWHGRDWHGGWHDHDRFAPRGYVYGGYPAPFYGYTYGYAPAPVYPAPALNFGVTIR